MVFTKHGDLIDDKPMGAQDAARALLNHDQHAWEIKQDDDGTWRLYVSPYSTNAYGGPGTRLQWPAYAADTEQGVFDSVLNMGGVNDSYARTLEIYIQELFDMAPHADDEDEFDNLINEIKRLKGF